VDSNKDDSLIACGCSDGTIFIFLASNQKMIYSINTLEQDIERPRCTGLKWR